MKLIKHDFLLADGAVLLFSQPILDAIAVVEMFTLKDGDIFALIDFIVAYAADFFGEGFLFSLHIL